MLYSSRSSHSPLFLCPILIPESDSPSIRIKKRLLSFETEAVKNQLTKKTISINRKTTLGTTCSAQSLICRITGNLFTGTILQISRTSRNPVGFLCPVVVSGTGNKGTNVSITEENVTKLFMIGTGSGQTVEEDTGIRRAGIGVHRRKIMIGKTNRRQIS